jgi:hypothetical protein
MGLLAFSVVISSSAFTDKAVALFSRLTCWNRGAIAFVKQEAIALRFCCNLRSALLFWLALSQVSCMGRVKRETHDLLYCGGLGMMGFVA